VLIEEPAGEAERLEAGVRVDADVAELVVLDSLDDCASGRVNDQSWAAEVITDNTIRHTCFDQVVWDIGFASVDEAREHVPSAVQFRHGIQLVLIQEPLNENTVDLFPDPSILAIDHVVDLHATRQRGTLQVPQHIIRERRRLAQDRIVLGEEFPVGGVGVLEVAVLRQAVLGVVRAVHSSSLVGRAQPVAVAIVSVVRRRRTVQVDVSQATGGVIRVHEGIRHPADRLHLLRNVPSNNNARLWTGRYNSIQLLLCPYRLLLF